MKFAGSRDAVDDANSGAADRQLCPRRAGDLPIGPDNADLPVYLHCPLMGAGISTLALSTRLFTSLHSYSENRLQPASYAAILEGRRTRLPANQGRSEEHTSELQSLLR